MTTSAITLRHPIETVVSPISPVAAVDSPVNIAGREHKADPFPFYARLRAEMPVCRVRLPDKQIAYVVSRYDDVTEVMRSDVFAKDRYTALRPDQVKTLPWMPAIFRPLLKNMLDQDPPNHTRLRALVQKAFTPGVVEAMRPRMERLAGELLAPLRNRWQIDLIRDFALPLPSIVIAELLGVPAEDHGRFCRWSKSFLAMHSSKLGMLLAVPAAWRFIRYARWLAQRKKVQPGDDLLSRLVLVEEAGERLSEDELVAMVVLLLVAGHETTTNLIGNGVLALLENPEQERRLRDEPALLRPAVEEMLRFASPVETATERYAREDVEIAGVTIPQGSLVFAAVASANRDAAMFAEPDKFDIAREPNKHVSFGLGRHYCLGAPLARMEAQIALRALLDQTTRLKLAADRRKLKWRSGLVLRGLEKLPLAPVWS